MIPTSALLQDTGTTFSPLGKKLKAVLVWPKFPGSYWSFAGMMELLPGKGRDASAGTHHHCLAVSA